MAKVAGLAHRALHLESLALPGSTIHGSSANAAIATDRADVWERGLMQFEEQTPGAGANDRRKSIRRQSPVRPAIVC